MNASIALVGCGAIAQRFYLSAMAHHRTALGRIWLIDQNPRMLSAASAHLSARTASTLENVDEELDYVIVATPNATHFQIAMEALSRNAHVLVEKPFVIWPGDGARLVETAAAKGRIVAVNQTRRFFPIAEPIRNRIRSGEFGILKSIQHNEGQKLSWPFETGAAFARTAQRTGVIMDLGVHVLDFLQMLLEPQWTFVSCEHDGFEGPEGLANIRLQANDAPVNIRLSRYMKQENRVHLAFEAGAISFDADAPNTYNVVEPNGRLRLFRVGPTVANYDLLGETVLANFLAAGAGEAKPVCAAATSLPTIALIDLIYRNATCYPAKTGVV